MKPETLETPDINKNTGLLLTIAMTGMMAFLQVYSIQSILPLLIKDFHIDVVAGGSLVGATVLAIAIMSPFTGMISDALTRRHFIIGAVFLLALPTAAMYWVQNEHQMLVLRFMQGLCVPAITVVLIAYIGEEFSGHLRLRLMTFYVSGTVFGGFMGRFLMGYLTDLMSWQDAFLIMASLSLIGTGMLLKYLPKSKNFVPKKNIWHSFTQLFQHIRNPNIIAPCMLGFCVMFSLVGCFTYINLHLAAKPYSFSSADLANIFIVYLIGMVVTPISVHIIKRYGISTTIILSIVLSITGMLLSLAAPVWLIIISLMMTCTGVFITQSSTINYIAINVSEGRSLASGLYYMAYYLGGTCGAWLCGYAYTHGQWFETVMSIIAVQCVGVLIVWTLMRRSDSTV